MAFKDQAPSLASYVGPRQVTMAPQLSRWIARRKPWQAFLLYLTFAELASAVAMTVGWHVTIRLTRICIHTWP